MAYFYQITCPYRLERRFQPIGLSHKLARHLISSIQRSSEAMKRPVFLVSIGVCRLESAPGEASFFSRITWRKAEKRVDFQAKQASIAQVPKLRQFMALR
jgi:hypothetical protein